MLHSNYFLFLFHFLSSIIILYIQLGEIKYSYVREIICSYMISSIPIYYK